MNRPVYEGLSGKYKIVEATIPLEINITEKDIDNAIPHDPRNCAIAEACRRGGATEAVIGATVAYIVAPSAHDQEVVAFKYSVSRGARRLIDRFDMTGIAPAGPVKLSRLKPSETAAFRKEERERRVEWDKGEPSYKRATQMKRRPTKIQLRDVHGVATTRAR